MAKKTISKITNKDVIQVKQRFMAKTFILIDRCQKEGKKQLIHFWDENEWQKMIDFIDTEYKDTKDENIKELRKYAVELIKLDMCLFAFAREFIENETKARERAKSKVPVRKKRERIYAKQL